MRNLFISSKKTIALVIDKKITAIRFLFYLSCIVILVQLMLQANDLNSSSFFRQGLYFLMGIVAATIANSTGAGGGIVFLPIFMSLGFVAEESLATSLAIQCFGMTSGALAWLAFKRKESREYSAQWRLIYFVLPVSAISSGAGLLCAQYGYIPLILDVELLFALFSFIVGLLILSRTLLVTSHYHGRTHSLSKKELVSLILVSFLGGVITSWISIGIGELLLVFLIAIQVRLNVAVAIAVCVSSISVLIAIPYHIPLGTINREVLVHAAPGALIGGVLARYFATYIGSYRLKIAASTWIVISSLPFIFMSL